MRVTILGWYFLIISTRGQSFTVTDYAPTPNITCPTDQLIREFTAENQSLFTGETTYIQKREATIVTQAWEDWLGTGSDIGYDVSLFKQKPRVGIALSGGGHRAAQYSAGVLNALDSRNATAKAAGVGGLLQVASYVSGLSGGSWLLGSLAFNEWPTLTDLVYGNGKGRDGWLLDLDLFTPAGVNVLDGKNLAFYGSIVSSVTAKAKAGFDISLTDPWSRAISYHFLNQTETTRANFFTNDSAHSAQQLWSNIPLTSNFTDQTAPFPIVILNSRAVGSKDTVLSLNSTVYEVSPFEFGSFDPDLSAMSTLAFSGAELQAGKSSGDNACVSGFDEAGFIMGTSSSLFNTLLNDGQAKLKALSAGLQFVLDRVLSDVRMQADDVANWPNPFGGIKPSTFRDSDDNRLELIDGGSNLETLPVSPLLVKSRAVDVIIAVDGAADTDTNWPDGISLITSSQRASSILSSSHRQLPPMPATEAEFISTGVNQRTTFFGCDSNPAEIPLVIYIPNSPPLTGADPVTNTDTFKLAYSSKHTTLFLDQAFNNTSGGFVPNSNNPDPNFGKCLQCAVIDRARSKLSPALSRSSACTDCFKQYCFDLANPPSVSELPNRKLQFVDPDPPSSFDKFKAFISKNKFAFIGGGLGLLAIIIGLIVLCVMQRRRKRHAKGKYAQVGTSIEMNHR